MAKAVKLADIAEQVGVSTVTVSKALSGQKGVSEENAGENKRILQKNLDTAVLQRRNGSLRKNNIISES